MENNGRRKKRRSPMEEQGALGREQKRIRQWLKQVRFRKTLFGGVDERDVWKKIGELNELYNAALVAERARYDALLEQQGILVGPDPDGIDTTIVGGERR